MLDERQNRFALVALNDDFAIFYAASCGEARFEPGGELFQVFRLSDKAADNGDGLAFAACALNLYAQTLLGKRQCVGLLFGCFDFVIEIWIGGEDYAKAVLPVVIGHKGSGKKMR